MLINHFITTLFIGIHDYIREKFEANQDRDSDEDINSLSSNKNNSANKVPVNK